ncbi:MAG: cryptochrome/photolyase family protein [Ignavibacteriaceae bacterium]|nr:cryptochrome/photolyase family protein [Ignavibacteriaceae bacterium]
MKSLNRNYRKIRLILGDQLNYQHSVFTLPDDTTLNVIMETADESAYVTHHIQKITGFFLAMRNFAEFLRSNGHHVLYIKISDPSNRHSFSENLSLLLKRYKVTEFEYFLPDEYRLDQLLKSFAEESGLIITLLDTDHFLTSRYEVKEFFNGKKSYLMESFYRYMRKKHGILMEGINPAGGTWNYDKENRRGYSKIIPHIPPLLFNNDASGIVKEIKRAGIKSIGRIESGHFIWPVNREQSLQLLQYFNENLLPLFGEYQDTMAEENWSFFHSRLSFAMNIKMLSPLEVINSVITRWKENPGKIKINQVEGFIRQILGWREYMRGVYWASMPEYEKTNFFGLERELPDFYWTGETKMNCLKNAISNSLDNAYAHHIQRLMITGNFALLAGISPDEVDRWYLGIYIDAIQWVEITNTRGMSQYADGGLIATKPYIGSANYINKMSNYCKACSYNKDQKTGSGSCPFNSLYWNFLMQHEEKLKHNNRLSMPYNLLRKMPAGEKTAIITQAEKYISNINTL